MPKKKVTSIAWKDTEWNFTDYPPALKKQQRAYKHRPTTNKPKNSTKP